MTQTCPSCHEEINEEDTFCSHCGTQLTSTKPLSRAQKIKIYVLSFLLTPFGLYWFFKFKKEMDPEKRLVANRALWITVAAIVFILAYGIVVATTYSILLNSYSVGYGF